MFSELVYNPGLVKKSELVYNPGLVEKAAESIGC